MGTDAAVSLGRLMLEQVIVLTAPVLMVAVMVSLVVNIVQVLTSLQDQTLSTIPRLLATGAILFILMPWMFRHLGTYTVGILGDFHKVLE